MDIITAQDAIHAVCIRRRKWTYLYRLHETAAGFDADIYTRMADPRSLNKLFEIVGLRVDGIAQIGNELFRFKMVIVP